MKLCCWVLLNVSFLQGSLALWCDELDPVLCDTCDSWERNRQKEEMMLLRKTILLFSLAFSLLDSGYSQGICPANQQSVIALSNGTLLFPPLPAGMANVDTAYDAGALEGWYNLANSFADAVRSGGLPYGEWRLWHHPWEYQYRDRHAHTHTHSLCVSLSLSLHFVTSHCVCVCGFAQSVYWYWCSFVFYPPCIKKKQRSKWFTMPPIIVRDVGSLCLSRIGPRFFSHNVLLQKMVVIVISATCKFLLSHFRIGR